MQTELHEGENRGRRDWILGLALFFWAFLPRVFGLGLFLTPDENLWVERSAGFLDALSQGDLAGTFQVGHPGVTTRWTGAIGIVARYLPDVFWKDGQLWVGQGPLTDVSAHLMDVLTATRLPTVLLFSCFVVIVCFLGRRLVGREVALLGAGLLALDPFCLAISRVIHHDALSTVFMTTSVLAFTVWLAERGQEAPSTPGRRWLLFSGAMAGLAFLSKSTSLFLVPATIVMALAYPWLRKATIPWKRLVASLALWGLAAAVVFVILWPAMWVDPVGTVTGVISKATGYAASPHERDNFFMGQLQADPGPLFYPAATLYQLTPVTTVGLLLSLAAVWRGRRSGDKAREQGQTSQEGETGGTPALQGKTASIWLLIFWGFVVSFTIFMTLGAKKFDRYLLPIYPYLNILAAAGLLEAARWISSWVGRRSMSRVSTTATGLILVVMLALQGLSSLPAYPYYLTAYNPLLGGIRQAARVLLIGWGEGYDQAAAYLNAKPHADNLNVATWYAKQTMAYLFKGHSWDVRVYHQEPIGVFPWTRADYMVLYINQLQRRIPNEKVLSFFQSLKPEHVVSLGGLDYAWIYRIPQEIPADISPYQFPVNEDFGGKVRLLGYDVDDGLTEFEGDHYLVITFYWQCLEPVGDNYRLYLKLINAVHHVWGKQEGYPVWDGFMTAEWQPGTIIRDVHGIVVEPGTPPGSYQVTVDWLQPYTQQTLLPDGGTFLAGPVDVPQQPTPSLDALGVQHLLEIDFADKIRLLGYNIEGRYRPGGNVHLELFWQVEGKTDQRYTVFNHLIGPDGQLVGQKDSEPVDGFYPTTEWMVGEVIRDQYDLTIPSTAPPGAYHIETGLYAPDSGQRLPVSDCAGRACADGDRVILEDIVIGP